MLKDIFFFNSTALSKSRVPLPVDSTERMVMTIQNSGFEFESTGSQELATCRRGTIFLTSLRLVYVPIVPEDFCSFFVPVRRMFSVGNGRVECMCDDNSTGWAYFHFESSPKLLLYEELRKLLSATTMEAIEDSEEDLPYYCEVHE